MMAGQEATPRPGRKLGSGKAGEDAGGRQEIWVVVRALLLLGGGIVILSWLIT